MKQQKIWAVLLTLCVAMLCTSAVAAPAVDDKKSHLHAAPGKPAGAVEEKDEGADFSKTLTGDWNGYRTKLYNQGVELTAAYTGDYFNNFSGGIKRGDGYMDNLDLQLALDGEKLYGVKGSKIFLYFLNNNGANLNASHVGSGEGIDNIEVNDTTFKLYEAWIEQSFFDEKASLRAGLYDLNSEFDVTDSSGIFIHPTYGIDTAFAVTGQNGPSIFPTTSLAARLKVNITDTLYAQAAILDGVPGDPNDGHGTQVNFDGDGALYVGELGYGELKTGRIVVGAWSFSDELAKLDASGNADAEGVYAAAEKTIYTPDASGERHLDAFARTAFTSGATSQFDYSWSAGLAYTGLCPTRPEDIAGLAFHGAHNSDVYKRATAGAEDAEWGVEVTYAAQLTPWLNLQPDLQYIHNPGTTPGIDDAWVAGARMAVNF